ncbi:hypothetical protein NEOKW01_1138 [Nematocida sp. AWRm80]|nr:hypothetical protein NEOKW01_1138 [Nematocida sp. AWRm80]
MDGETYRSISSFSRIFQEDTRIDFIRGVSLEEGVFRVQVIKRIEKYKYVIRDISGTGTLITETKVPKGSILLVIGTRDTQIPTEIISRVSTPFKIVTALGNLLG